MRTNLRTLLPGPGLALVLTSLGACLAFGEDRFTALDLRQVQVGGEIGRRIDITIRNNLLVLDVDRDFLAPFRTKTRSDGYIGLGKLIDAASRFAAYSGDPKVLKLKKHLVDTILATQERDGYIGMLVPQSRMRGLWDVHEIGYLIWGLLTDEAYHGEVRSLAAARKAADYLMAHWSEVPEDWAGTTGVATNVAVTGLERTILALYRRTGDPAYLDFVVNRRALPRWNLGIEVGRREGIEGHVYAYMARCLAQIELNQLRPGAELLRPAHRAIDFMLDHDGALVSGATGQAEIWTENQDGRGDLGETCATAYQLRVADALLRHVGQARLGDLIERTIFNSLFAAQSPDGRHLRYFSPVEGPRVYFSGDSYCCPCNYRRIVSELPLMVFYRADNGLVVNLYTPAQARLQVARDVVLSVVQETNYPNSGRVQLRLDPSRPASFPVRLRIPLWAGSARVTINEQPQDVKPQPGTFLVLQREWKSGDRITLEMPMAWRLVKGRQRQAGRVAIMRGPLIFSLNPAAYPEFAKQDAADLGAFLLDPSSLSDPVPSTAVRPDGLACRVRLWPPGFGMGRPSEKKVEWTLTEFSDPDGRATYFSLRDARVAVEDELFSVAH